MQCRKWLNGVQRAEDCRDLAASHLPSTASREPDSGPRAEPCTESPDTQSDEIQYEWTKQGQKIRDAAREWSEAAETTDSTAVAWNIAINARCADMPLVDARKLATDALR